MAAPGRAARAWRLPAVVAAGGAALLVVVAIAAVAVYLIGSPLLTSRPTTYPVGDEPRALLFDGTALWVANYFDNTITKLAVAGCADSAPECGQPLGTFPVDALPGALAFDGDHLWVTGALEQVLSVIDPASGAVVARHQLPHVPSSLLAAESFLWIANDIAGTLTKVSEDGSILADLEVGARPVGLAYDGGNLWVINRGDRSLVRVAPAGPSVEEIVPLEGEPTAIAFDGRSLWVAFADLGRVVAYDIENPTAGLTVDIGSPPAALWFDGFDLWAAAPEAGTVVRIDPLEGRVIDSIAIEGYPVALHSTACGPSCRDLWTANQSGDSVSRVAVR